MRATLIVLLASLSLIAQEERSRPAEPHRIIGNVFYVGTEDLACFLITSPQGHILINTGYQDSVPLIKSSIQKLGFKLTDVKTLLTMQAHSDHVGGMAEMAKQSGARLLATEEDAKLLVDGGFSDFHFGGKQNFTPVKVSSTLQDGQRLPAGGSELTVHLHPGHTKGTASYTMQVKENGRSYDVCFANMATINPGVKLTGNAKYPKIADDYALTFKKQQELRCDVFLSAHAAQYGLHDKRKPGQPYSPDVFVDAAGYKKAVASYEAKYRDQLAQEKK